MVPCTRRAWRVRTRLDNHAPLAYACRRMQETTRGRWAFGLTSASVLWGLALVPAAFLVPVYSTAGSTPATGRGVARTVEAWHGGATLVAVNGASLRLLIVLALPAALAAVAWAGLHQLCTRGRITGRRVATAAILLLTALTVLTGFSIGIDMLPALALLIVGRALTPAA
jgi:hypothetical protein